MVSFELSLRSHRVGAASQALPDTARLLQHLDFHYNELIMGDLRFFSGMKLLSCMWVLAAQALAPLFSVPVVLVFLRAVLCCIALHWGASRRRHLTLSLPLFCQNISTLTKYTYMYLYRYIYYVPFWLN